MSLRDARRALEALASPERAKVSARFFKTGPGEYGEGDRFLGVRVPATRGVAKQFRDLALADIETLLHSEFHEERQLAVIVLVLRFANGDPVKRKAIFDFYWANAKRVNNWDLVDASAPAIVGGWLFDQSRHPLRALAKSANLWERRIAIVATQHFIRKDDYDDTLAIARLLLKDSEDLIHKATGWMLREVGDRDLAPLDAFLAEHSGAMPRTMLRYAIEKLPPADRQRWMKTR